MIEAIGWAAALISALLLLYEYLVYEDQSLRQYATILKIKTYSDWVFFEWGTDENCECDVCHTG